MARSAKANEVVITRFYEAPVQAVWDAWTDPDQVAQWWGPRGFTITTKHKELRAGGTWVYTMHGPDGVDYPNITTYFVVEPGKKLVYDHGATPDTPPLFRVTVEFRAVRGGTEMEMTSAFATPEVAREMRKFIKQASGESTWDRLGEYLVEKSTGAPTFLLNRSFDAPIATLFEMWTNPEHLARWLPPQGAEMRFLRADIRTGGSSFYAMTMGGRTMYGRADYGEIRRPDRIVYRQQFCDEHEKVARHPMDPNWPEDMETVITLAEEGPERTRVTIAWKPFEPKAKAEVETFVKAKSGMHQGWTGSLDKLESHLASR